MVFRCWNTNNFRGMVHGRTQLQKHFLNKRDRFLPRLAAWVAQSMDFSRTIWLHDFSTALPRGGSATLSGTCLPLYLEHWLDNNWTEALQIAGGLLGVEPGWDRGGDGKMEKTGTDKCKFAREYKWGVTLSNSGKCKQSCSCVACTNLTQAHQIGKQFLIGQRFQISACMPFSEQKFCLPVNLRWK